MKRFDVQAIEIKAPFDKAFAYIADAENLPKWTSAFSAVSGPQALLQTAEGSVEIVLAVNASLQHGTIDWSMTFPDGSVATAYSRVVDAGNGLSIYSFILLAPPVPLEQLEGTLKQQSRILSDELARLCAILEERAAE